MLHKIWNISNRYRVNHSNLSISEKNSINKRKNAVLKTWLKRKTPSQKQTKTRLAKIVKKNITDIYTSVLKIYCLERKKSNLTRFL